MKKFISMLAGVVMATSMFAVSAYAAGNVSFSADKIEINEGESVVFTIDSAEKSLATEGFNIEFDTDAFECTAITNASGKAGITLTYYAEDMDMDMPIALDKSTVDLANSQGKAAFGKSISGDPVLIYEKAAVAVVTFKAANVDADTTYTFKLNENSDGTTGYVGLVDTIEVTVKNIPDEPTVTWKPASAEWTAANEGKQAIWWPQDYAAGDFPGFVTVKVTDGTTTKTVGVGAAEGFNIEGAVSFAVAVILDADVDATNFNCVVE